MKILLEVYYCASTARNLAITFGLISLGLFIYGTSLFFVIITLILCINEIRKIYEKTPYLIASNYGIVIEAQQPIAWNTIQEIAIKTMPYGKAYKPEL